MDGVDDTESMDVPKNVEFNPNANPYSIPHMLFSQDQQAAFNFDTPLKITSPTLKEYQFAGT